MMSSANKNRSPEFRKKQSEKMKEKWKDPEYREQMMARRREPSVKAKQKAGIVRARSRMSDSMKKKWEDPEYQAKQRAIRADPEFRAKIKGRIVSPETRYKISKANKGRKPSDEARAKMSAAQQGRKHTPAARHKISIAKKGKPFGVKHRAALREAWERKKDRGWKLSEETLAKMSKSQKNIARNPEERERRRQRMKEYYSSPENREKLSKQIREHYDKPGAREKASQRGKEYFASEKGKETLGKISVSLRGDRPIDMKSIGTETEFSYARRETLIKEKLGEQGGGCAICGKKQDWHCYEPDHIVPLRNGGIDAAENCQILCYVCNRAKQNKDNAMMIQAAKEAGYFQMYHRHSTIDDAEKSYWRFLDCRNRLSRRTKGRPEKPAMNAS